MKKLFKKYRELIMYAIFGVLTTLINIGVFYVLKKLGVGTYVNNTIAWIASVLFAFVTNKYYVFNSKARDKKTFTKEAISFFGARLVSYFIDMGLMYLLIDIINIDKMLAKIITNVIVIIINYVVSKLVVFRKEWSNEKNISNCPVL